MTLNELIKMLEAYRDETGNGDLEVRSMDEAAGFYPAVIHIEKFSEEYLQIFMDSRYPPGGDGGSK